MLVYVVTMYRFAQRYNHSYVSGVYKDELRALKEAEKEQMFRGGTKYYPEIWEYDLDNEKRRRVLKLGDEVNALTLQERHDWAQKLYE